MSSTCRDPASERRDRHADPAQDREARRSEDEPDKQWITIDTNPQSPHFGRIYAMWVDFTGPFTAHPVVSFADAHPDGTHTTPQGATYLLPHVTPDGNVWTTLTTTLPGMKFSFDTIALDRSTDGGQTWTNVSVVGSNIAAVPGQFANKTFRDGIENSFATGTTVVKGHYPLYVAWEDYSAGVANVLLSAPNDGGATWSVPIQVNDNQEADGWH